MENKEQRIEEALETASHAFWTEVAKKFPEAKYGDFPPEMQIQLDEVMKKSIRVWLDFNLPQ